MEAGHGLPRELSPTDVTIDAPPGAYDTPNDSGTGIGSTFGHDEIRPVALVEGSGVRLSSETQDLLRCRLRSASVVMFGGFVLFLLWSLFRVEDWSNPAHQLLIGAHVCVAALLGFFGFSLCRSCSISTEQLRWQELAIFGAPALFFLLLEAVRQPLCMERSFLYNPVPGWLLLMFTYALFIPNTWQRAAMFIGVFAAAPIVSMLVQCGVHPQFWNAHNGGWFHITEVALELGLAAVTSVLGVAIIGGLRREAFAAKQLNQYKLRKLIGSGGMGEVHLAEHSLLKRPCAIKIIRPEKAGDPKVLARFEREVRAAARLTHWNSIEIFDYGRTEDGTFFYVMEYLPGLSLQELVDKHGPLPPERVTYLLQQTCDALAEAHRLGLIHRDIKPANIFAAQRGGVYDVAKLLDFGLVKPSLELQATNLTQDGAIAGSPLYMSPEQAVGEHAPDARSDIYSLGAMAYYLLTGRPPFVDERPIKVLMAHSYETPQPPSRYESSVPLDLERIVLKCLEKKPADRYQNVEQLADELRLCACAGGWTSADARRWWERNEAASHTDPLAEAREEQEHHLATT